MTAPSPKSSHPTPAAVAPMRCVICHPATAELPGELLTSLSKRMGRMTICADVYGALAECCLIQRECAMADSGGRAGTTVGAGQASAVLILVHPRHMPESAGVRLVEAVRQYAPGVALWYYDRGANPKLRAVVEEDVSRAFAVAIPPTAVAISAAGPVLAARPAADFVPKLVNGTGHGHSAPMARPARGASLLTEEELRMLLSGDPLEGGPLPIRPARGPAKGGAS